MKKYYIILVAALLLSTVLFFVLWRGANAERRRVETNFEVLTTLAVPYKVRDSLHALSQNVMQLKIDELRSLRSRDVALISDLGLRLRRVQSVANVSMESNYQYLAASTSDSVWQVKDNYITFTAQKVREQPAKLAVEVKTYDTIVQILHRVPRFKIFGIWLGTKGVRQEIVSKNPHTKIVAAEFLNIVK